MEMDYTLRAGILEIPCRLEMPLGGEPQRVVLGVHGLGGSMEDEIQAGIAEEMTLFGAASIRFDLPCHGENRGEENLLSLQPCLDALLAVAADAVERFPQAQLCVFATGFGAYLTLVALPRLRQLCGDLRLVIQTPGLRMHDTILSMLRMSKETLRAMERKTLAAPKPFDVSYGFYEELRQNVVLAAHEMPMLILHGESDDYIPMSDIRAFRNVNEEAKLVIIPGTSHRFQEDGAWDMVLDLTRDWFSYQQVLVTDWE
jgi:alpha-beta hydrolase superfamily lysophospholipase